MIFFYFFYIELLTNKNDLREYIKTVLPIDEELKLKASERLNNNIMQSKYYKNAYTILSYMALPDEISIFNADMRNKYIYIPKVNKENGTMNFFRYTSEIDIETGAYKIKEPTNKEIFSTKIFSGNILVIVPGRSFTRNGKRLGRGKGFYDKYLSTLINNYGRNYITLMGVCYKEQILDDIPVDFYDIPMDVVITDEFLNF